MWLLSCLGIYVIDNFKDILHIDNNMSIKNNEKIYQQNVLDIFKSLLGAKEDKQLAEIIGMTPEELANRKRRGTLVQLIFAEALKRGFDLNAIFQPNKSQGLKRDFLMEIEEWLDQLCKKQEGREVWFEHQFLDNFSNFREWKEEKERKEEIRVDTSIQKIA